MKRLTQSLNVKIGVIVLLVEVFCLALIGYYFSSRFQAQVDETILTNVRKPGMLIMRGVLGYDIVTDPKMLQDLVGLEPVDGMVVGVGGNRIYFSMRPEYQNKSIEDVPGLQPAWFVSDVRRNLVLPVQENGQDYLVSVIPIFYEEDSPMLYAYFKVNTSRAQQEKQMIAWTFALGTVLTVLISSLVIFLVYRRLVAQRLAITLAAVQRLESGDLSTRLSGSAGEDQIDILQQGINAMAARLERSASAFQVQMDEIQKGRTALQESQARLELALEGAGLGVWDWDIKTGHVTYNQHLANMLGYTLEEIQPHIGGWEEMIHPADLPQMMHAFAEHFAGRTPSYEKEIRMRTRAGDWKWILARGKVVEYYPDGMPRRAAGTYLDISDRRQAEEALRDSQTRYRSLFQNAPVALQEVDFSGLLTIVDRLQRKGVTDLRTHFQTHTELLRQCLESFRVLDANKATLDLYGVKSLEEFIENLPLLLSDKIPERFAEALAGMAAGQLEYEVEDINRNLQGEHFNIHMKWLVAPGYEKTLKKVLVAVTDITARKKAEQAVIESRARYRSLFENSPTPLWEQDFSGIKKILNDLQRAGVRDFETYLRQHTEVARQALEAVRLLDANRATLELYGATSQAELFHNLAEIFPDQLPEYYIEEQAAIARGATFFECERANRRIDGQTIIIQLRWVVAPGCEENYERVFVSIIDVTERRRVERALQESQTRYLSLFENAPVSLWEQDYSQVKCLLDEIKAQGVSDLRAYLEQNPAEVARCNAAFRVLDANQATLQLYGASSKQELFRNMPVVLGVRSHQAMIEGLVAISEGHREIDLDVANQTLDGETIDVLLKSIVVPGYEDTQEKVIVSITDLTQRKRAEAALFESRARYRSLFENSPIPLWVEDMSQARQILATLRRQHNIQDMRAYLKANPTVVLDCVRTIRMTDANQATLALFGARSLDELMDNLDRRLGEQVAGHFIDELVTIANGGSAFECETVNYRLDGEKIEIQVYWVAAPGCEESYQQVFLSVIDVTANRKAEQAVFESQARYRSLFENAPVSLWEQDFSQVKQMLDELKAQGVADLTAYFEQHPDECERINAAHRVVDVNQTTLQLYGASSKEELIENLPLVLGGKDPRRMIRDLVEIAGGRLEFEQETTNARLDGEIIPVYIKSIVAPGFEENQGKVFVSITDLTQLKQAEEALRESQARFRSLFENSPVALWEEDMSGPRQIIERLRSEGVDDLRGYLEAHPEVVATCAQCIRTLDLNQAALRLHGNLTKEQALNSKPPFLEGVIQDKLIDELLCLAEGRPAYEGEKVSYDAQGNEWIYQVKWSVAPGYEESYAKIITSVVDLTELKHAEAALRQSQQRLDLALQGADLGLWDWDARTQTTYRNNRYVEMLGYTAQEMQSHDSWENQIHPDDRPRVDRLHEDLFNGRIPSLEAEYRLKAKDGSWVWVLARGKIVERDAEGHALRYVGTHLDITGRKEAEEALRQSQQRLELAVQGGDLGLWDWIVPTGFSVYNRKWAEMLGFTLEEIESTVDAWKSLIHPDDYPHVFEKLKAHIAGIAPLYEHEFRMRTKQGGWVWVLSRGQVVERDAEGKALRIAGTHQDITSRKAAEAALRQSQQRLELAVEGGNLGLWDWNLSGESTKNQRYADMLGYPLEVVQQPHFWEDTMHPDDAGEVLRRQQDHLEGRTPFFEAEFRMRAAHGEWKWILSRGQVVERDAEGKALRMAGTHLDITERKLAEQALAESRQKLRLIYQILPVGILITDADNRVIDINPAAVRLLDIPPERLLQRSLMDAKFRIRPNGEPLPEEEFPGLRAIRHQTVIQGEVMGLDLPGGLRWVTVSAAPLPLPDSGAVIAFEDITARVDNENRIKADQERFEILYRLYRLSGRQEGEIIDFALEASVRITQSTLGYVAFTNEDESILTMYAWSKEVMQECSIKDTPFTYQVTETGLWGEAIRQRKAIITNDYNAPNPLKRGVPEGHVKMTRHMNVPTFDGQHIVIVCGVANKAGPYDENDVLHLQLLMDGLWGILRRKRAEETLRESRQRLELALRGGDLGLWDRDLVTGHTVRNPRYAEMLGYTLDEISPTVSFWEESIHPEDLERVRKANQDHWEGRTPIYEAEYRMQTKTGAWKWILGRGMVVERDARGNPLRMVGTNMDIDQRKRAEEALRARILALTEPVGGTAALAFSDVFDLEEIQQIQDAFAEATGVSSIITDVEGHPITRPSNFCALCKGIRSNETGLRLCMESDATLGKPNLSGPIMRPCLSAGLWNAGASITLGDQHLANWLIGQVLTEDFDEQKLMAYAREIGVDEAACREALKSVNRMPLEQFRNVAQALFIIARQISRLALQNMLQAREIDRRMRSEAALRDSERKILELNEDLERRVLARTADLQEANRELESFSYSISHDLRAPLRAIDGFSRILEEDYGGQLDKEAHQYLNLVRQNSRRMAQLIDDLLTFSRMGRQTLSKRPVQLRALAEQVFGELMQVEPEARRVEFILKDLPTWQIDASLMRQVFSNLLSNALKFTSRREHAVIEVGCLEEDGRQVCYVRDNGAGFDMNYADKLFGVFQRLHRSEDFPGTGVGLAIVQRIINRHGGKIWARAAVDKGATFYFTLGD